MARRLLALFLLAALPALGGCGGLCNLTPSPGCFDPASASPNLPRRVVFGGTRLDAAFGSQTVAYAFEEGPSEFSAFGFTWGSFVLLVDMPASAAVDLLTLPYILWKGPGQTYEETWGALHRLIPPNNTQSGEKPADTSDGIRP